jgi:hypothetical protein
MDSAWGHFTSGFVEDVNRLGRRLSFIRPNLPGYPPQLVLRDGMYALGHAFRTIWLDIEEVYPGSGVPAHITPAYNKIKVVQPERRIGSTDEESN